MVDLERFHNGDREYFRELMGEYEGLAHSIVGGFAQDIDTTKDWSQDACLFPDVPIPTVVIQQVLAATRPGRRLKAEPD